MLVSWYPSSYDQPIASLISTYRLWRSIDAAFAHALAGRSDWLPNEQRHSSSGKAIMYHVAATDSFWEFVAEEPASGLTGYSYMTSTPFDSTAAANPLTSFFVEARSGDGAYRFSSDPVAGYSVDNLAPAAPQGLTALYIPSHSARLHWSRNVEQDVSYYAVYRGGSEGFLPSTLNRIGATRDTVLIDGAFDGTTYYKVSAVDVHDNESAFALLKPSQVASVDDTAVPPVTVLRQNYPNPFNPETVMPVGLASPGFTVLRIYSPTGAVVRTLMSGYRPKGTQYVRWDGRDDRGRLLSSGVYVARLSTQDASRSIKMVISR